MVAHVVLYPDDDVILSYSHAFVIKTYIGYTNLLSQSRLSHVSQIRVKIRYPSLMKIKVNILLNERFG